MVDPRPQVATPESALAEQRKSRDAGRSAGTDADARIEFDAKRWCVLELVALARSVAMQPDVGGSKWHSLAMRLEVAQLAQVLRPQSCPFEQMVLANQKVVREAQIEHGRETRSIGIERTKA